MPLSPLSGSSLVDVFNQIIQNRSYPPGTLPWYLQKEGDAVYAGFVRQVDLDEGGLKSLVQALHPTPAVCGFPKQTVQNFIQSNEGYNREFYTGFLGELNLTETAYVRIIFFKYP